MPECDFETSWSLGPWDLGTLEPFDPGTLGPWNLGTLWPSDLGTLGFGTLGQFSVRVRYYTCWTQTLQLWIINCLLLFAHLKSISIMKSDRFPTKQTPLRWPVSIEIKSRRQHRRVAVCIDVSVTFIINYTKLSFEIRFINIRTF